MNSDSLTSTVFTYRYSPGHYGWGLVYMTRQRGFDCLSDRTDKGKSMHRLLLDEKWREYECIT